jgi:hypothetical protein
MGKIAKGGRHRDYFLFNHVNYSPTGWVSLLEFTMIAWNKSIS